MVSLSTKTGNFLREISIISHIIIQGNYCILTFMTIIDHCKCHQMLSGFIITAESQNVSTAFILRTANYSIQTNCQLKVNLPLIFKKMFINQTFSLYPYDFFTWSLLSYLRGHMKM